MSFLRGRQLCHTYKSSFRSFLRVVPLLCPLHRQVGNDKRRHHVPNLAGTSAEGIEDSGVGGTGKWIQTVGAEAVGDYTALGWELWMTWA